MTTTLSCKAMLLATAHLAMRSSNKTMTAMKNKILSQGVLWSVLCHALMWNTSMLDAGGR